MYKRVSFKINSRRPLQRSHNNVLDAAKSEQRSPSTRLPKLQRRSLQQHYQQNTMPKPPKKRKYSPEEIKAGTGHVRSYDDWVILLKSPEVGSKLGISHLFVEEIS